MVYLKTLEPLTVSRELNMGESYVDPKTASASPLKIVPELVRRPATNPAGAGFILMNSLLNPVNYNHEAVKILTYPDVLPGPGRLDGVLAQRIRTNLLSEYPTSGKPIFVGEFKSGRRPYVCRSFDFGSHMGGDEYSGVGLLLERKLAGIIALDGIAQQFRFTQREREAVEYLLRGLTSKEIAGQMKISANTVKCFLRLVMIKMGVTTRSGIIGKIVTCQND